MSLKKSITERWEEFHAANPHVYEELERLALALVDAGKTRIGVRMLWETMRYNVTLRTLGDEGFKLNDHFPPLYARKLIEDHPALARRIELRERRAA